MTDDPRLNPHPEEGTDGLLQGLNTLTKDDLLAMKEFLTAFRTKAPDEDPSKSPNTVRYMNIIRQVMGHNAADIFANGQSGLTRERLYQIYDEMDESTAYVTSALDIISDDATQPDDDGRLVYIESENEKVRSVIEDLFEELEIESKLSKWARAIAKYGDLFVKVYGSSDKDEPGVSSLDDTLYPSRISRRDFRGKLVAFVDEDNAGVTKDSYRPPWTYIHFRHKGELSPERTQTTALDRDQVSLSSSYGQSILKAAVKVYTQLRFVENMILLSRLTNSVRRNIFAINVGEVDPKSAFETIKEYADLLKKDINLDLDESIYKSSRHTASYDEDIFIPVSDPKNDFNVTSVGGDANIAEQYDLEYLLNKLFAALKIPKAYLNYEQDLNARSTLIQLDIRYARSVSQLQNTLVAGLTRLVKIHLAYIGMDPEMIDFKIYLTSVSSIDQESRLEQKTQRVAAARDFWDVIVSVNDTLRDNMAEPTEDLGDTHPAGAGSSGSLGDALDDLRSDLPTEDEIEPAGDSTEETPESEVDTASKKVSPKRKLTESARIQYNSPLDLEYLASKLLGEYLEFPEDEVKRILRLDMTDSEKRTNEKRSNRPRRSTSSSRVDDSTISYPSEDGKKLYESTIARYKSSLEVVDPIDGTQESEDEQSNDKPNSD